MSRRLPRPDTRTRLGAEFSAAELAAAERVAYLMRLSVASTLRVLVLDAAANEGRLADWQRIIGHLQAAGADQPKPGRRKKSKPG